jgi:hypothetical protein
MEEARRRGPVPPRRRGGPRQSCRTAVPRPAAPPWRTALSRRAAVKVTQQQELARPPSRRQSSLCKPPPAAGTGLGGGPHRPPGPGEGARRRQAGDGGSAGGLRLWGGGGMGLVPGRWPAKTVVVRLSKRTPPCFGWLGDQSTRGDDGAQLFCYHATPLLYFALFVV